MSKIEDALNKIKISKAKGLSIVKNNFNADGVDSNAKNLVRSIQDSKVITHTSSVKQIAKMKNELVIDNSQLSEMKVIFSNMPDNEIADVYRDLRTKIIHASEGKNTTVMLTSCIPGHYSSLTSLNLAAAFSLDESKTSLLVDCNLNNPQLCSILDFDISNKGLTDYLEDDGVNIEDILHESGIKRLRVIPAGMSREVVAEYFTSLRMRNLMSDLISRYSDRYVFIDSAPIIESADTRILVELCDFVILVVPYGKATKSKISEAVAAIGENKLLGVVFTDKPPLPSLRMLNIKSTSI